MIKRTLYLGNPCYRKRKDLQLTLGYPLKKDSLQSI